MSGSTGTGRGHLPTGRVAAACLFLFAVAYGLIGARIDYAFASDPLGPRVFPVALAIALAGFALLFARRPDGAEDLPRGPLLGRTLAIPALAVSAVLLMEPLGFPIAIFVLTTGVARVFGAGWPRAALGGALHAALWWAVFVAALEVYLPTGTVFG